jgi:hypothetical protein
VRPGDASRGMPRGLDDRAGCHPDGTPAEGDDAVAAPNGCCACIGYEFGERFTSHKAVPSPRRGGEGGTARFLANVSWLYSTVYFIFRGGFADRLFTLSSILLLSSAAEEKTPQRRARGQPLVRTVCRFVKARVGISGKLPTADLNKVQL